MQTILCYGPRMTVPQGIKVNTTSKSPDQWSTQLSPFYLGPVPAYKDYISQNVENLYQFAKVYKVFTDLNGDPKPTYFVWAQYGWGMKQANRYPMGKGAKPEYSYWDGEKLDYVEARKRIYIPTYGNAVMKTEAFQKLQALYAAGESLAFFDFDGYDYESMGMTIDDAINYTERPFGHSLVLKGLLEGTIIL